jgi:hypothetical protein
VLGEKRKIDEIWQIAARRLSRVYQGGGGIALFPAPRFW